MSPVHEPLPPNVSFPALEEQVLARWRERDVFRASLRNREGGAAVRLLRGPADRQRLPGLAPRARARLQGRLPALQDDDRALRRAQGRLGHARAAGRDRGRAEARLQVQGGHRALRHRGVQPPVPRGGARAPRGLARADRADRATGSTSTTPTTRSSRATSSRSGGRSRRCGTATCSTRATRSCPYCARCGTALSSHEVAQGYKDVEDPSVYVRFPVTRPAGALREGDTLLVWTTTPWTLVVQRRRRRRSRADLRAHGGRRGARRGARRARARRGRRDRRPLPRRASMLGAGYEPPFPFIAGRGVRRRRATPCCPATSSAPTTAPASSTPRSRSARTTSGSAPSRASTVVNPVRLDGTYDERIGPYAGPLGQGRRRRPDRGPARARPAAARRDARCTPTRTAGAAARRCSTTPSRPGTSARRRCATGCSPPTRRSTGTRRTSSTAASASGWRTTSTGRSRASATGARRCRSGAARTATPSASARSPRSRSARAASCPTRTGPYVDEHTLAVRASATARCAACPR